MNDVNDAAEAGVVAFDNLNRQAQKAGASIATALANGQIEGRKLEDVLRDVGSRLGTIALRTAGSSLTSSLTSTLGQALVSTATTAGTQSFSLASPAALSGLDNGYAASQRVSVEPVAYNQAARPINLTLNISTPDAESFRRSEAQVTATLARAVQRGQRSF
jgi:hypothetical protein